MGLDNYITIKNKKRSELPKLFHYPLDEDYNGVDICYWRKCWGLRRDILTGIGQPTGGNDYEIRLSRADVLYIWRLLIDYLRNPRHWQDSIWDFSEIKKNLRRQKWNLCLLYYWMKRHPEAEVYFYDSY